MLSQFTESRSVIRKTAMSQATHYATAPEDRIPFHQKLIYGVGDTVT
jgi:hypothetical protein